MSEETLLLSSDYPPKDGGVARLCQEIVLAERHRGWQVRVIAPLRNLQAANASADRIDLPVSARRLRMEAGMFTHMRALRGKGPAICALWYPDGLIAVAAGVRPLVVLAHGSELMPVASPLRAPIWLALRRKVLRAADLVIANSRYTRDLVLRDGPGIEVVDIPLGVDHERFVPGDREAARRKWKVEGKFVVASVSRICAYKGHDVVLQAMARLPETVRQKMVYLVAGKGPHLAALQREAERLGVAGHTRWLGFVAESDLPDLYNAADLFALCTRETVDQREVEGFGLVFLEAQACGTPVVGTRTGGIPDAIEVGKGGWLIEQDDATALSELLRSLAADPVCLQAARLAARERVEAGCTWNHYMERFRATLVKKGIYAG
jgi:phosphatidylinositol alpha-1,6-mannosyltransferase